MDRLNQLAAAYGVQGGSLGPVAEVISANAPHVLGTSDLKAVLGVVSVVVSDGDTFAALLAGRDVSSEVRTLMETTAGVSHPMTPANVIVGEVLDDIRRVAGAS